MGKRASPDREKKTKKTMDFLCRLESIWWAGCHIGLEPKQPGGCNNELKVTAQSHPW
jgi:hypothetical protein